MFPGLDPISLPTAVMLIGFAACEAKPVPAVQVHLNIGQVSYDLSKSYAELGGFDITTVSPYTVHDHTRVAGLTGGKINIASDMNIAWSTSPITQSNCLWFEEINVNIDLDTTVYIAAEHEKNSCMFSEIKNHEWKHVVTDRELLEKYKPLFEEAALEASEKLGVVGPITSSQNQQMRQQMARVIEAALGRVSNQLNREREKKQQAIDSRKEYDRLSRACK